MPEHYTKSTVSATYWCAKCGAATEHRVDGGRRGPCLKCLAAMPVAVEKPETPAAVQEELFGGAR